MQRRLFWLSVIVLLTFARHASAQGGGDIKLTRDIKVISSAGARALADACTAWAEKNKLIVAMAILDWGGNLIESHAMEGAAANAIDTALLKAKSALRWRRATSETNKLVALPSSTSSRGSWTIGTPSSKSGGALSKAIVTTPAASVREKRQPEIHIVRFRLKPVPRLDGWR